MDVLLKTPIITLLYDSCFYKQIQLYEEFSGYLVIQMICHLKISANKKKKTVSAIACQILHHPPEHIFQEQIKKVIWQNFRFFQSEFRVCKRKGKKIERQIFAGRKLLWRKMTPWIS